MSLVLGQLLQQRCSIYRTTVADEYGNGPRRVAVVEHALCRLNERGESRFEKNAGGAVITGSARCWLDGDVPVRKGDVVVDDDTHNEFTVARVYKPRDLILSTVVDYTELLLE